MKEDYPIQAEDGWIGGFTRNEALGAWRNGTRVRKVNSEPGDGNPNGTMGTVLGSLSHAEIANGEVCYFVEWDTAKRHAVAVMHRRVEAVA